MLWYYKFRQELFDPVPGREVYVKHPGGGRGWPEECPPIRAANAFGFDLLANFDLTFVRGRDGWRVADDVTFSQATSTGRRTPEAEGAPLAQQYAWFWERGQTLPHKITDDVYAVVQHQAKVSSFLYLRTEPNELLLMTDVPNRAGGGRGGR